MNVEKFWNDLIQSDMYKEYMDTMEHDFQKMDEIERYVRESSILTREQLTKPFTC